MSENNNGENGFKTSVWWEWRGKVVASIEHIVEDIKTIYGEVGSFKDKESKDIDTIKQTIESLKREVILLPKADDVEKIYKRVQALEDRVTCIETEHKMLAYKVSIIVAILTFALTKFGGAILALLFKQ